MCRAHHFLSRYRLIAINILIYDLIALATAISADCNFAFNVDVAVDSDKSSASAASLSAGSRITSAVSMQRTDVADIAAAVAIVDNCTGIVDNFPNKNQIISATKSANVTACCRTATSPSVATSDLLLSRPPAASQQPLLTKNANAATAKSSSLALSPLQRMLSRPKRYLAFPEGASFSVAVCFTVGIIGNPAYNYMSFGLNWGVAYDLPNTSWVLNHLHGFARHPVPLATLRRRTRRSLYTQIEHLVENMGYNGRDCVLRALCESRQFFQKSKMSMIGEMLRVIFSLPKQRLFTRELRENADIELYDHAYRKGRALNCAEVFTCGFSLLELAFGKYSTPPPGYYEPH